VRRWGGTVTGLMGRAPGRLESQRGAGGGGKRQEGVVGLLTASCGFVEMGHGKWNWGGDQEKINNQSQYFQRDGGKKKP